MKFCPINKSKVLYIECLDCEDKFICRDLINQHKITVDKQETKDYNNVVTNTDKLSKGVPV